MKTSIPVGAKSVCRDAPPNSMTSAQRPSAAHMMATVISKMTTENKRLSKEEKKKVLIIFDDCMVIKLSITINRNETFSQNAP